MALKIEFNRNKRNVIYIYLIHNFRNCFLDTTKMKVKINPSRFFDIFFMFLHNPFLDKTINDPKYRNGSDFVNYFLFNLNEKYENQDDRTNEYIVDTLLKNIDSFKDLLEKRKEIINSVAQKIWLSTSNLDDITIWVKSEEIIEKDLISKNTNDSPYSINIRCINFNYNTKSFPPIIIKKV